MITSRRFSRCTCPVALESQAMDNPIFHDFADLEVRVIAHREKTHVVRVAVFTSGFRDQFFEWSRWMEHYGFEIRTEFDQKADGGYGAYTAYLDKGGADILLDLQKADPTRFGTPWTERKFL